MFTMNLSNFIVQLILGGNVSMFSVLPYESLQLKTRSKITSLSLFLCAYHIY